MDKRDIVAVIIGILVGAAVFYGCVSSIPSVHMQTIEAWQEMLRDTTEEYR